MKKFFLRLVSYFAIWYLFIVSPFVLNYFYGGKLSVSGGSCVIFCISDREILSFLAPIFAFILSIFTALLVYVTEGTISAVKTQAGPGQKPKLHNVFVISVALLIFYLVLKNPFLEQLIGNRKIQTILEIILAGANFFIAVIYDKYNQKVRGQVLGSILVSVVLFFFALTNAPAY